MCDVFHCIGIEPVDIQKVGKQRKKKRNKARQSLSRAITPRTRWNQYNYETAESVTESTCSFETESTWSNSDERMDENVRSQNTLKNHSILSDSNRLLLQQICDQFDRRGNLKLIFPRIHNIEKYKQFHLNATNNDHLLWNFLSLSTEEKQDILKPHGNEQNLSPLLLNTPRYDMETSSNTTISSSTNGASSHISYSQSPELQNECSILTNKIMIKKAKKKLEKKHNALPKKKKIKQRKKYTKPKVSRLATAKRCSAGSRRSSNASTSTVSSIYQSPKRVAFPISTRNIQLMDESSFV